MTVKIGNKQRTRLEPIPEEMEILKTIYALRDRGLGSRKISMEVQSLFSVPFSYQKVDKILRRKFQGLSEAS